MNRKGGDFWKEFEPMGSLSRSSSTTGAREVSNPSKPPVARTNEPTHPIKLRDPSTSHFTARDIVYRDGIELEKGLALTEDHLLRHEHLWEDLWSTFSAYPDLYLDIITPINSKFKLYPYQRIFLRACMRYTTIYITATRGAAKTFLAILAKYLQCILIPGHVGAIVAPQKGQAAKITKQKIYEIWSIFPLLKDELKVYKGEPHANFGKDYTDLYFKNGSRLSIGAALNSDRGLRTHATLLDEVRDLDGDMVSEVIIPQMNVSRRTSLGTINPYEKINTQIIYATSAGMKSSFAYEALIGTLQDSIIDPRANFCLGVDYRIPVKHGLLDPQYIRKLKLSPSYEEQTFAAEYMGVWLGGSEESWFKFDKLAKYRYLKNPEWKQKFKDCPNIFYLISVDVGRLSDQTVACIFRVSERGGVLYSTLVNLFVLGRQAETKTFYNQSLDLKKLIRAYAPREVVIDCNGLGIGIADEMIRQQVDEFGTIYEPYGFFNNTDFKKIQPKDAPQILYSMKANAALNSKIHGNAFTRINSGLVRFLISEQEARAQILSTKTGQKLSVEKRIRRLMPHELTTKLFDEMANLRLRKTGLEIALEQINSRFPKDKYSAFSYGLFRIKEIEEALALRTKRRAKGNRKLVFFTGGV